MFKNTLKVTLFLIFNIPLIAFSQDSWRGLVVEEENRCSPYDKKKQYPYPQTVEDTIVDLMGGRIYGPYTGSYFESDTQTDIEHIVSTSQAHNSGLCRASSAIRKQFATDQLNLTLASPKVNRCGFGGKCGFDAAEWMPEINKCWFANRIVQIKTKYRLSVDKAEVNALESVLSRCSSFDMIYTDNDNASYSHIYQPDIVNALDMYDDNKNGKITCAEARKHGIAPVTKESPAYPFMRDSDGDGVVCR